MNDPVEIAQIEETRILLLEPRIYLVQLAGQLTREVSNRVSMIIDEHANEPRCVLYETTPEFIGYDSQLRAVHAWSPGLVRTIHIGVITTNPLLRMVTATLSIALRKIKGIPLASYGSLPAAVTGAREALRRRTH